MNKYQFTPDPRPINSIERILRFKPEGQVPRAPSNMPLWYYLNVFFEELFSQHSATIVYYHSAEELAGDLVARFGGSHDIAAIERFLELEYRIRHDQFRYAFKREDFIKPITQ